MLEDFELEFLGKKHVFNNGLFYTYTVDGDGFGTAGSVGGGGFGIYCEEGDDLKSWQLSFRFQKYK